MRPPLPRKRGPVRAVFRSVASTRRILPGQETAGSVQYGDGGNPSLLCGANNRRSQFPRVSVAIDDIDTDPDRRKEFLPVIAGEFLHERVGGSNRRSDGQEPVRIVKYQDHGIEFDWGVPFHDTILPM